MRKMNFVAAAAVGMSFAAASAQAVPTLQFIYVTTSSNVYDVYARVTGTGGDLAQTDGLTSYSILVQYDAVAGNNGKNAQVAWNQNNLKATAANVNETKGFWRPSTGPGDTVVRPVLGTVGAYDYSIANTQFDSFDPLENIGLSAVTAAASSGSNVNLGSVAFLGNLTLNGGGTLGGSYDIVTDGGLFADGGTGVERNVLNPDLGEMNVSQVFTLPGDLNFDGVVNLSDLTVLATFYNQSGQSLATGDFNKDFVVNLSDLTIMATFYNQSFGEPTFAEALQLTGLSIPEPSCLALLGLGSLGLVARRRQ